MYYLTFEIYNFILDRPQKVSLSQVEEAQVEFPKITVCSPAFFNKTKYDNEIYTIRSSSVKLSVIMSSSHCQCCFG